MALILGGEMTIESTSDPVCPKIGQGEIYKHFKRLENKHLSSHQKEPVFLIRHFVWLTQQNRKIRTDMCIY